MRNRRKLLDLILVGAMTAALGIGSAGAANATVVDDPGYIHVKNGLSGKCLLGDLGTGQVQQYRCENTATEEWSVVSVLVPAVGNGVMFANKWTSQCMAVPGWPSNGTKIVEMPCNASDARQLWDEVPTQTAGFYRIFSFQGSQTMCLDKPTEADNDGLQIQTWVCADQDPDWNPFFNYHTEQYWSNL